MRWCARVEIISWPLAGNTNQISHVLCPYSTNRRMSLTSAWHGVPLVCPRSYTKAFKPEGNNRKRGKEINSLLRATQMGHLCRSLLLFVGSMKAHKCHCEVAAELLQAAPNSFVADVSGFPSVWRLGSEIHCNRLSCSTKQATLSAPRKRNINSSER